MNTSFALRPAWTPLTIALMVGGFILFWPLGLLMLAYILWGDRIPEITRHFEMSGETKRQWAGFRGCASRSSSSSNSSNFGSRASGNAAFDEYREKELKRLEEERRKLDVDLREFEDYLHDLRRARDQEEFDRFMRNRANRTSGGDTIDL